MQDASDTKGSTLTAPSYPPPSLVQRALSSDTDTVTDTTQDPVRDLRYTGATILLRERVRPSVASERLCRSSAASMMTVYRHGVRRILVEAAALLAAAVFESRELRYA